MRQLINETPKRFDTDKFHNIDELIAWLNECKAKGGNYIDFTSYSNVVKCRELYISEDDDFEMGDEIV